MRIQPNWKSVVDGLRGRRCLVTHGTLSGTESPTTVAATVLNAVAGRMVCAVCNFTKIFEIFGKNFNIFKNFAFLCIFMGFFFKNFASNALLGLQSVIASDLLALLDVLQLGGKAFTGPGR